MDGSSAAAVTAAALTAAVRDAHHWLWCSVTRRWHSQVPAMRNSGQRESVSKRAGCHSKDRAAVV